MLNITENSISKQISLKDFKSYKLIRRSKVNNLSILLIGGFLLTVAIFMFLPWTQNISTKGFVTTILPEQRPQSIQSVIAGRLEKWYVQEGQFVEKGDTIVFISEVKSEYFDPNLIERTTEQVEAKSQSVQSYDKKITALKNQYVALEQALTLKEGQILNKIQQARNKISIDSMDLVAFQTNLKIAENQLERTRELHNKGLKSLSELQEKELKLQEAFAKVSVQENKLLNQKNELENIRIELVAIEREYADKLAKSLSDQQTALSDKFEGIVETSKLQNQLSNYSERQKFYHITAPQSGYITQTVKTGIGETIKEGTDIATIMPELYDLAVSVFLKPQDVPLVNIGDKVRLRFDGWPAIIISGWPEASTGVFTGRIIAIDRFINDKGYYRILVSPDLEEKKWPVNLRVGTGTQAFILLNDVPIWYEVWRQLNGFPADFYNSDEEIQTEIERKAPIKYVP